MRLWKRLFPVSGMVLVMVAGILLAGCGKQQRHLSNQPGKTSW